MTSPLASRSRTAPALVALGELPPAAPPATRRYLPLFLITLGVVLGMALVLVTSFNAQRSARDMRDAILLEAADNASACVQSALDEGPPALRLVSRLLEGEPACRPGAALPPGSEAWRVRGCLLRQALLAFGQVDALYLGDRWGGCTMAERVQGPPRVRISFTSVDARSAPLTMYDVDARGAWTPVPVKPSTPPYDPRERPWYKTAVQGGGFAWTQPYVDPEGGLEISAVLPLARKGEPPWAVLGTDVLATTLAQRMRGTGQDSSLVQFVVAHDGTLVAAPDLEAGADANTSSPRPPAARDSRNALVAGAARAMDAHGAPSAGADLAPYALDLDAPAGSYRCACYPWRVGSHVWTTVAVARSTWLVGFVQTATHVTTGVCLVALLGTIALALRIRRLRAAIQAEREMGSYRLVERLGHGRLGEVWLARHHMLARPAALEIIRPDHLGVGGALQAHQYFEHLRKEAAIAATLKCPHTAVLYDFGTSDDGTFYMVMELLDGLRLDDLVTRHGPQPPSRVIGMLREVCLSLAEAHEKGLFHRHLGPAQVYLCRMGAETDVVKVLGFGLAEEEPSLDGRAEDVRAVARLGWWLLTAGEPPAEGAETGVPADLRAVLRACDEPGMEALEVERRLQACEDAGRWTEEQAEVFWSGIPLRQSWRDA